MEKSKNIFLSLASFFTWIALIIFVKKDPKIDKNAKQIGNLDTLKTSAFARGMFMDIGTISSILSTWIIKTNVGPWKWIFAVGVMIFGSFAFLPFLTIYFLKKAFK